MKITVSLVEDDPDARQLLAGWIAAAPQFELQGTYAHVGTALAQLPKQAPDVVVMDINLDGQSGIHCIRQLVPVLPHTQFLMVTVFEDSDHIFDALTAGASGYLLKQMRREEFIDAIEQVHAGGAPMTSYVARKVVQWFRRKPERAEGTDALSPREHEVLRHLARGRTYKEMADALGVGIGTINTHVRRIYQKLHVSSRGEAVALFSHFPSDPAEALALSSRERERRW